MRFLLRLLTEGWPGWVDVGGSYTTKRSPIPASKQARLDPCQFPMTLSDFERQEVYVRSQVFQQTSVRTISTDLERPNLWHGQCGVGVCFLRSGTLLSQVCGSQRSQPSTYSHTLWPTTTEFCMVTLGDGVFVGSQPHHTLKGRGAQCNQNQLFGNPYIPFHLDHRPTKYGTGNRHVFNDNDKRLGLTAKADQPDHKKTHYTKNKNAQWSSAKILTSKPFTIY